MRVHKDIVVICAEKHMRTRDASTEELRFLKLRKSREMRPIESAPVKATVKLRLYDGLHPLESRKNETSTLKIIKTHSGLGYGKTLLIESNIVPLELFPELSPFSSSIALTRGSSPTASDAMRWPVSISKQPLRLKCSSSPRKRRKVGYLRD